MKLYRFFIVVLMQVAGMVSGSSQSGVQPFSRAAEAANPVFDTASFKPDDTSPVIIADIFITGNKKTKSYIVEREIPFKIGNAMMRGELPAKLELARQQLMNTSLFIDVEVKVDRQVEDLVFITVAVKERWYFFPLPYFKIVARNFNEWWVEYNKSLQHVNYGLKLMHNNVSGRNDQLHLYLVNGYTQQASFSYSQPAADRSLKFGFDIGLDYSRNKELNYQVDSNKMLFYKADNFLIQNFHSVIGISYRPRIKTRHFLRFGYTRTSVDKAVLQLNPEFFPSGKTPLSYPDITYSISYNNVDYIPYPTKGVTFSGSFMRRGFTKDMDLWQLTAAGTYTIPIFTKSQLFLQGIGTMKFPFDQPYYNKRLLGFGDLYMRGLEYYVADGIAGFVGRATARREVLNFHIKPPIVIEGHDKIPFRIFVKMYGDLGYAYDKSPSGYSSLTNKWLKTWGVGIDIVSFYDFVIRFEYSFNQLNEQGLFLHSRSDF
jgi:outer membrane protein assembly factor BamA